MIIIKNKAAIAKMETAGRLLNDVFTVVMPQVAVGMSTSDVDALVQKELAARKLVSQSKGYMGYKHVSCISRNDEVVHGVPRKDAIIKDGDLITLDVCAAWEGYCADMARSWFVGKENKKGQELIAVAQSALNKGIDKARAGNRLSDVSWAIQQEVEAHGFGVVRDFAGHGIGKHMHEDPEVLNYGKPGMGPVLVSGMAFAIEPMITFGSYKVYITDDKWTVKTKDQSLAAHVEDTVIITDGEPKITTRSNDKG